jgi:hypothetical protein
MRPVLFLVAAVAYAQTPPDPTMVLDQARAKIATAMKRLPKYACVQTIDRSYYASPKSRPGETSCDQMSADRKNGQKSLRLEKTDRLRLDVAQGLETEIHSRPGASRFDLTELHQIVDSGPFGTGSFGGYLVDIFDNDGTQYDYEGQRTTGNRSVYVYGYAVAQSVSHYEIEDGASWFTTAYSGTFEVDPETFEIGRLTVHTSELPVETHICHADSTMDYQRVEIGDGSFLLPGRTRLQLMLRDGQETDNTTVYTSCREFHAESAVSFSAPSPAAAKAAEGAPNSGRNCRADWRWNSA